MKINLFVLLLVVIIPLNSFAQLSQGSIVVGGEFSFKISNSKTEQGSNNYDGPVYTRFSIMPDAEYFFAENFSVGLGIGYAFDKKKTETSNSETIDKSGIFSISPSLKKYFPLGDKAFFYGKLSTEFGFGKETNEYKVGPITTSTEENSTIFSIGIIPGFRYNITDRVGLEAGVGYFGFSNSTNKSGSGNNKKKDISNSFNFSIIPNSLSLGIRYMLN